MNEIYQNVIDTLCRRGRRFLALLGVTAVTWIALVAIVWAQSHPATLRASRDSASPGATVRITVNPSLGDDQPIGSRLLLRSAQGRGGVADIELQITEWHGDWLHARIPRDASTDTGALLFVLVDRRGNVIASSGNRFFRIEEASAAPREGQTSQGQGSPATKQDTVAAAHGVQKPVQSPPQKPSPQDRSLEKPSRPTPDASPRTNPRPTPDIEPKSPSLTTPGVIAGKGHEISPAPTRLGSVADFVVIADRATEIRREGQESFSFTLPADTKLNDRAVLAYVINPDPGGVDAYITLSINGHEIKGYTFNSGANRGMWEAFDGAGILRVGANTFEFRVRAHGFSVSDIVLWFHREAQ